MHGHKKKAVFFIHCLESYSRERSVARGQIEVLDIGCGNGVNVSLPVAERGFKVTGIDPHGPSIEAARSWRILPNIRFLKENFSEHRAERLYDFVILSDVLEHVPDPELAIQAALRNLKPGGEVLISVPNGHGPFEIEQFLIRRGVLSPLLSLTRWVVSLGVRTKKTVRRGSVGPAPAGPPPSNEECTHVQFFSLQGFERLLRTQGLVIEQRVNGAWFGGDLSYFLFYFVPILIPITLRVADVLPPFLVSSWYFECQRSPARQNSGEEEKTST